MAKQPNQTTLFNRFMPIYGEPPKRSTQNWTDLYNKSPRMNPIHQIASDVATSDYGVFDKSDPTTKLKDNSLVKLLKNPNSNVTITEYVLFYITEVYLLLPSGEAFWIKERNGLGQVTEVWPVPPAWVNEIPRQTNHFFTIYASGNMSSTPIRVPPQDMVYFKRPDVVNPYLRGIGRVDGIGDEIETDEYMAKYEKRFFFNNAVPDMVGMMPGADPNVIDRTEEKWNTKFGGFNNSHKTAWLNFDAKFQILKETTKDMDFIESRKYLRDVSNQHFSIPPELLGILENSNRSTIDAAYFLYTKNVLRKELKFIDDTINIQLVPDFGDFIFRHDNVVPEDEEFELKKSSEGLKSGALLVDEWRVTNGMEPLPDNKGQVLYIPFNMMIVPIKEDVVIEPIAPVEPPEKQEKDLTGEQKARMWIILDKAATKNERMFNNAMKKFFQSQQNRINQDLLKTAKAFNDVDWEEEDILLLAVMTPLWLATFTESFNTVNVTFGFGLSQDFMQPKFTNWIDRFGLDQAKEINNTTKGKLQKTLSEGITNGESVPKLRDRVSGVYTEAKTSRAEKIAITETHNTVGIVTQETYQTAGVQQKEWLTTTDGRERDSHAAIDGQIVGVNQTFGNGLSFPGDPTGAAEEVVDCRCVLLPVLG